MDQTTEQLIDAVRNGDIESMERFIAQGADAQVRDSWLLRLAALHGDDKAVGCLLKYCDARAQDSSALRLAAEAGHTECVRLLLPHSNPNAENAKAFCLAASNGHFDVVKILVPVCSFDITNDYNDFEDSAMYACVCSGQPEIFQLFLNSLNNKDKQSINCDIWSEEILLTENINERAMSMLKMLNPLKYLSRQTAQAICENHYHRLDQEMADLILNRSSCDELLDFISEENKYSFLTATAYHGRVDLLCAFFKYDCRKDYTIDLIDKMFQMFKITYRFNLNQDHFNEDQFAMGLKCVADHIGGALKDTVGDDVLFLASASGKKTLFETLLPYCDLERTHANAKGTSQELELLETYNARRLRRVLVDKVEDTGSAHKRKM